MSIRVQLVDDHEVIRIGVCRLLEGSIFDVQCASDKKGALNLAKAFKPQVLLMDVRLGKDDGLKLVPEILASFPETKVIILSAYDNPTFIARSLAAGAHDYLLKDVTRELLIKSIQCAVKNSEPPDRSLIWPIREAMRATKLRNCELTADLTDREQQVLRHISLGLSNREIASSLAISVETVKEHVQNVLRKIDVTDRTSAAVWAVKNNLL